MKVGDPAEFARRYADVIVGRLLLTDTLDGQGRESPLKLASLYTDQKPANDISRLLAASQRFPIYSSIAEALFAKGHEVIAVDPKEEVVDRIAPHVTRAAVGDGGEVQVLERIGAGSADAGVISTGDDITASILATLALQDLKVRDVFVKVVSRDHARVGHRADPGVLERPLRPPAHDSLVALAHLLVTHAEPVRAPHLEVLDHGRGAHAQLERECPPFLMREVDGA
jgi:hypothetical protein